MFLQTWSSEMENTTRGRTYSLNSIFKFQPYLNVVNISKFRIALTRFRVSAHRLEVEAGDRTSMKKYFLKAKQIDNQLTDKKI